MPSNRHTQQPSDDQEWKPTFAGFPEFTQPALCAETDPEEWFPEKGGSSKTAKAVCGRCPARQECLQHAVDRDERFGVWGGLSTAERDRLSGRRPALTEKPLALYAPRERASSISPDERDKVRAWTARGWSASMIGLALGVHQRTIVRVRAELRAEAA